MGTTNHFKCLYIYLFAVMTLVTQLQAFTVTVTSSIRKAAVTKKKSHNYEQKGNGENSWSVTDDWDQLSHRENGPSDTWQQDVLARAAYYMQQEQLDNAEDVTDNNTDQEDWGVTKTIQQIYTNSYPSSFLKDEISPSVAAAAKAWSNDTGVTEIESINDEEVMNQEIAQLIRCNQNPTQFLIGQGRAVPALTVQEEFNVRQLVEITVNNDNDAKVGSFHYQATPFFQQAVETIFHQHAVLLKRNQSPATKSKHLDGTDRIMDSSAVASWYQTCLDISPSRCGPYDARIQHIISKFGEYGKGYLELPQFISLYMQAIVGTTTAKYNRDRSSNEHHIIPDDLDIGYDVLMLQRRTDIDHVWRDLEKHGIESPNKVAWKQRVQAMEKEKAALRVQGGPSLISSDAFVDECEIIDERNYGNQGEYWAQDTDTGNWKRSGVKSSHELVEMCNNDPTIPARMKDGDFVFIDEESCIGCTQCVVAAPSNFCMLEHNGGRARTFHQDTTPDVAAAVATCPVNCMHYVGFERLVELERARDDDSVLQSKRDHFRHFGPRRQQGRSSQSVDNTTSKEKATNESTDIHNRSSSGASQWIAHTPLFVSRMQSSDANHKESIYHYFRNQCYKSSNCPGNGCYDCPMHASDPKGNPHWKRKTQNDIHVRAQHFLESGIADAFRTKVDL